MIRPSLRIAQLALELLEDRITPTISMSYVSGAYSGVSLGDYNETSVAAGDFNGDGLSDVAIATYQGIGIVMNEGNGNFDCTGLVTVGSTPNIIRAGDVFGNGKQDLVVGCDNSNDIFVVPGNGDGTFGTPIAINAGSAVQDLALADLTGDGELDVIAGTQNGIAVALNNGVGGFEAPVIYPGNATNIAVGDFTGNGMQDIAASIQNSDVIDVYLNDGHGAFGIPTSITTPDGYQPGSITAGDFNNDGEADLAVNYQGTGAIGVMLSNGDGTFQSPIWVNSSLSAQGNAMVGAVDFDNSGNLDLFFINNNAQVILPGDGQGGFGSPISITTSYGPPWGGNAFAVGDLTGDGYPDVIDAPFEVAFNLSGGDTINSFQMSAPDTATVGQTVNLTIEAEAAGNTPLHSYTGTIDWDINGQQSGLPGSSTQFPNYQDGVMTFQFIPKAAGYLTIGVVDQNDPAATGSVTIAVSALPSMIDASTSIVETANTQDASGVPDAVTVTVSDTSGNPVSGLASQNFAFALLGGTSTGTFGPVAETSTPGTYTAAFTGVVAGTPDTLLVKVDGVPLAAEPRIAVVPGSPDSGETSVFLATPTVISGGLDVLTVVARDAAGNLVTDLTNSDFKVALGAGASTGSFSSISSTGKAGNYSARLTGLVAGSPTPVTVVIDDVEITPEPMVQVTPGAINDATSKASFATLTDPEGSADLMTISVADAHDNAITDLPGTAFSFALPSRRSTGSFGVVSETSTPGIYTVPFTGLQLQPKMEVTVTILAVKLVSEPLVIVVPGTPDVQLTTVAVTAPTVVSGMSDSVTIRVKDVFDNLVGGLSPSDFTGELLYGTSSGTMGSVMPTATPGIYRATLTGMMAGTPSWFAITLNGQPLQSGPTVTVVPGSVSAENSSVVIASSTITAGTTDAVTIRLSDADGNPIVGRKAGDFSIRLSGGLSTAAIGSFRPTIPGGYAVTLTGLKAGSASSLTVVVDGVTLMTRPQVQVTPGGVSGPNSIARVSATQVNSGGTVTLTVVLKDAEGNAITRLTTSDFQLSDSSTGYGSFGSVEQTDTPGTYSVTFSPLDGGIYELIIEVSGVVLSEKPKVKVV